MKWVILLLIGAIGIGCTGSGSPPLDSKTIVLTGTDFPYAAHDWLSREYDAQDWWLADTSLQSYALNKGRGFANGYKVNYVEKCPTTPCHPGFSQRMTDILALSFDDEDAARTAYSHADEPRSSGSGESTFNTGDKELWRMGRPDLDFEFVAFEYEICAVNDNYCGTRYRVVARQGRVVILVKGDEDNTSQELVDLAQKMAVMVRSMEAQ